MLYIWILAICTDFQPRNRRTAIIWLCTYFTSQVFFFEQKGVISWHGSHHQTLVNIWQIFGTVTIHTCTCCYHLFCFQTSDNSHENSYIQEQAIGHPCVITVVTVVSCGGGDGYGLKPHSRAVSIQITTGNVCSLLHPGVSQLPPNPLTACVYGWAMGNMHMYTNRHTTMPMSMFTPDKNGVDLHYSSGKIQ